MIRLRSGRAIGAVLVLFIAAPASPAQTFTNIAFFDGSDGGGIVSPLIQGSDGNLYGSAGSGGRDGAGTVFKVTQQGILTRIYSFCPKANCADGSQPMGALALGPDGNFYGTTFAGGDASCSPPNGCGTVFRVTPHGVLTTLHAFGGSDGEQPSVGLILGSDGNFYGTTQGGGSNSCFCGVVFRITPGGVTSTLHSFSGDDGASPLAALVQATNGNLYGTTYQGGSSLACSSGCGTVFEVTKAGSFTSLHSFDMSDGDEPLGQLFQASNGIFYGTTFSGGDNGTGYGTIFRMLPSGAFATVHHFHQNDGNAGNSQSGLVQATDGNFYGGSPDGGASAGEIFEFILPGTVKSLYDFSPIGCSGGYTGLFQATSGTLYGSDGCAPSGAIFSLDVGLGPFVSFVSPVGEPGKTARILGQNLTGTTSVTFNGQGAASFEVVSDTFMTAVVPNGATTGPVVVTTPTGPLTSNVAFRVTK